FLPTQFSTGFCIMPALHTDWPHPAFLPPHKLKEAIERCQCHIHAGRRVAFHKPLLIPHCQFLCNRSSLCPLGKSTQLVLIPLNRFLCPLLFEQLPTKAAYCSFLNFILHSTY